jgi:hypothetical protein
MSSRNLGKQNEDLGTGDSVRVVYIERTSCCIEVRYAGGQLNKRASRKLLSYAIYNVKGIAEISHKTTEHDRKKHGTDLAPLLAIEQAHYPDYPIHIL